jgi:hypothetical protein
VVRIFGYSPKDRGFDFGPYHSSWVVVRLERGPLSLLSCLNEKVVVPV